MRNDVRLVEDRVARLHSEDGALRAVELVTGERVDREAGFVAGDYAVSAADVAASLGLATTTNPWGMEVIEADASGKTSVAGVYAIGDARNGFAGLINAAADGYTCAAHIVHEVAGERWTAG